MDLGFEAVGIAPLRPSDHADLYRAWIDRGLHGDMAYLARENAVEARLDPRARWPELRSAVVVAHHYSESESESESEAGGATFGDPATGVIARYARGRDYHRVVKKKLMALLRFVEEETGRTLATARAYVDTGPVLERELARRAGLGWQGRNTMLIDPRRGSWFFLGSLLLPFELEYDDPFTADRCGSCTACLEACPTGALLGRDESGAPVMDSTRCISYLTIEQQGPIPEELRPQMGNRVYGCDICQEVCPFTRTFSSPSAEPAYASRAPGEPPFGVEPEPGSPPAHPGTESPSLVELLETALDEAAWDSFSRGSAIRRAGRAGFARNVCVGLGNWGGPEAVPVLTAALSDPEPLVRAHAAWALGRVDSAEARGALSSRLSVEPDESVRAEIAAVLAP
jgi:epoxyqueuosine reductase